MITSNLERKVGLWTHVTERTTGRLHDIRAAGFDYLVVKVQDGTNAYHAEALSRLTHERDAAGLDLPFIYWGYVYPENPVGDAKAIAAALPTNATDFVIDAEIEWENAVRSIGMVAVVEKVHAFCRALRAARPTLRLHLSSFWSTKLHASFPFRAFLTYYCSTWMPQAYVERGSRTVENVIGGASDEGLALIAGTKMGMIVTVNNPSAVPLLKARGYGEFTVYAWDPEGDAQVCNNVSAWTKAIKEFRTLPPVK